MSEIRAHSFFDKINIKSLSISMFMIESIALTLLGGIVGVLIGEAITLGLALSSGWAYHFYAAPPLLGLSVSVLTGLLSGIYPAFRAARLDPIQCLTSE